MKKSSISKKKSNKKILLPKIIALKGFLSFFILHELKNCELSGDDLARIIGDRKGSILTPGTIYPALKRLRKAGLIKFKRNGRKKVYYLTKLGEIELVALYTVFKRYFFGLKGRLKR